MKTRFLFLLSLLSLVFCLSSKAANVTNVVCYDDYTYFHLNYGNGGYTWDPSGMTMGGSMYGNIGDAGSVYGTIYTDDPVDPTFMLRTVVENDTTFGWSGFHVNVWMTNNFSISAQTVHYPATLQPGWTGVITSQPVFNGSVWLGQLDYSGPTIEIGETLDFSYKITFTGSTDYPFTQQMIAVPEPGALSLLAIGGLLLGRLKRAKRA